MPGEIRIGTSGWHYKHWRGPFYPDDLPSSRMLEFYIQHFDTVEINNSFYKLPAADTFASWRDATPKGFLFTVKASRFLTHMKKLKDPEQGLGNLLPRVEVLKRKLGPILFQLPPFWNLDLDRLAAFLEALPPNHRYAFEFRHSGWHQPLVYELLARHNAAFCIYELAGFRSPVEVTANFAYVRLHGPEGAYGGRYDTAALLNWSRQIREWRKKLKAIYVYFDNDQEGFAALNALELKAMAGEAPTADVALLRAQVKDGKRQKPPKRSAGHRPRKIG
jgi:uncharacterized protein YecE (DUF72 family)